MNYFKLTLPVRAYDLFNLRRGEERIVGLILAFSFFQFFSVALFFIAANAIFLSNHPITNLPYVFVATGVALIFIDRLFVLLERYISSVKLILSETIMLIFVVLILRFGFVVDNTLWLGVALIVWYRIMADVVSDGFNRLALVLFDVRQGKRLFGLISSAEIPANILGYFSATLLVPFIGTSNLLFISAAALMLSFVFLAAIISSNKKELVHEEEEVIVRQKVQLAQEVNWMKRLFHSRFIFVLSITVFFSVIAFTFIEFAFLSRIDAEYTNQQEIVLFMAVIFGTGQVIAFLIKTFLYGFIQRQFGIKVSLFVLPVTLAVISIATLLESFFSNAPFLLMWTWVVIMLITEMLKSSVYNTTFISLLQPMSKTTRLKGYDILGTVENVAISLCGVILVVFFSLVNLDLLHYSALLLLVVIAWIAFIPSLNKNYLATLEDVLKKRIIEGGELELSNPQTLEVVYDKLHSKHPGEVLYALDVLCKDRAKVKGEMICELLYHPLPEVRREAYQRIEQLRLTSLLPEVRERVREEPLSSIRKLAIHAYCFLGEATVVDEVIPYLDDSDKDIQTGAYVGLICYGGINGIIVAGQRLMENVNSTSVSQRVFAAHVIGEVGIRNFYHPLLTLLRDESVEVEKEALKAAGRIAHPKLYPSMLKAVSSPVVFEVAVNALVRSGSDIIDDLEPEINNTENSTPHLRRLIYVCGRVGGNRSISLLKNKLYFPDIEVRNQVLQSCAMAGYRTSHADKEYLLKTIHLELADASFLLTCIESVMVTNRWLQRSNLQLLINALQVDVNHIKRRILFLMAFLYNSREVLHLWNNLQMKNREKAANSLEILDVIASKELTAVVLPLLEDFSLQQQLKILTAKYPVKKHSLDDFLVKLITGQDCPIILPWTRAVAVFMANQIKVPTVVEALQVARQNNNKLIAETAGWTLQNLELENPAELPLFNNHQNQVLLQNPVQVMTSLLTIEKVMALKTTGLFRETAEDLLVDIAYIINEVAYKKGEAIVNKNEVGTCMYIIYSGSVKVHDGDHTLAQLNSRDFFGELSLLDAEPRSASVTALEDSLLLRIDQHAFYEIMADRMEVIQEIMKILCSRLRHQNQEVARLGEQLAQIQKNQPV